MLLPRSKGYRRFWVVTVIGAVATALFEPAAFAFKANPGLRYAGAWHGSGMVCTAGAAAVFDGLCVLWLWRLDV